MKNFFTALTILLCFKVNAQKFEWAKDLSSNIYTSINAMTTDPGGNIYITGSFAGTADFDPGPGTATLTSAGSDDIFVAKLDASGNLIWVKSAGGTVGDWGLAVQVDAGGNVYVAGGFMGTADFDPGPATVTLQSAGTQSYDTNGFIWILNQSGVFIQVSHISATGSTEIKNMIIRNTDMYVAGIFKGTADFDPSITSYTLGAVNSQGFVGRYTLAGNVSWVRSIDCFSWVNSLTLDNSNNVLSTGMFNGTADFDPSTTTQNLSSTTPDAFIWKLNSNGDYVWAKQVGGSSSDHGKGIAVSNSGNVYVTGSFNNTVDFDPGSGTFTLAATPGTTLTPVQTDAFIVNLAADGSFLWAKKAGSDANDLGISTAIDQSGDVYLGGTFQNTVDLNPGGTGGVLNGKSGSNNSFIAKLDAQGNFMWAGHITPNENTLYCLYASTSSDIFACGFYVSSCDLDPTAGVSTFTATGTGEAYLVKLSEMILSINKFNHSQTNVFPVPATNLLSIENAPLGSFRIIDLLGREVISGELSNGAIQKINISALSKGIYCLEINSGTSVEARKIVVE
jgi:uncharacterized protein (DUF2249 family)